MTEQSEPIAVVAEPNGGVAEAYRSLRVSLTKQMALGKKVFVFVSAWPGDGKSMVCTNLAVALSQLHQKVLLVDGDLRRPTISRIFGAHKIAGISDDLEKAPTQLQMGYASKYPNLFLLPRGLSEQTPANLLSPERLPRLFAAYRDSYDVVIVDTPPLSACSDALLLGGQSDGAAMVISPKGWDGEVEARYKQQLDEHGITVLGAVLNGAQGSESHGYGYAYGARYGSSYGGNYGYGYGDQDSSIRPKRPRTKGFSWPWQRPDDEN